MTLVMTGNGNINIMKKIAVVGVGSAGILSICHMLNYLPQYKVYSIHDPNIDSIGIGESTNPFFSVTLQECLGISLNEIIECGDIDATFKCGTYYKNWRKKDFLNPLFGNKKFDSIALHFNTFKIKDFVFDILRKKYKDRFVEILGTSQQIQNNNNNVTLYVDGEQHTFDYVIDCTGFPKCFDDYNILPMPLNHCLVHNVLSEDGVNWKYTLHQATENGWLFGVPLTHRISYGYMFNDKITTTEDAKKDFSKIIGVELQNLEKIEFKFKSYYIEKVIDGRILKNGNAAFFLEPMFANSLWLYDFVNRLFFDYIIGGIDEHQLNFEFQNKALEIHDLICFQYHGGSNYDTNFWKYAVTYSKEILTNSKFFFEHKRRYQYMKKNKCELYSTYPFGPKNLQIMHDNFEYDYW